MCNAKNEQTNRGIALSLALLAGISSGAWAQSLPSANSRTSSGLVVSSGAVASEHESPQQRRGRFGAPEAGVYKARITPHWFQNDTRFWYRNDLRGGAKEFIVVDAEKGTRQPAFDHQKLAAALSKSAGQEFKADRLPFAEIEFIDDGHAIEFRAAEKTWHCNLSSYECTTVAGSANIGSPTSEKNEIALVDFAPPSPMDSELESSPAVDEERPSPQERPARQRQDNAQSQTRSRDQDQSQSDEEESSRGRFRERRSPDGRWTAFVKDNNVWLRSGSGGKEEELSTDGATNNSYGRLEWAPDSQALVAWRIEPGDRKEVYLIQSSPSGGGRAILHTRPYAQAGDKFTRYEVNVFSIPERKQIKPEVDRFEHEWETPRVHWTHDHRHFVYEQEDRGHQRLRLIEVDARTGGTQNLIDEKTKTFIWTTHTEMLNVPAVTWLENSDELIYMSEMDGWRHLYLVDAQGCKIKNQITKGEWVVRGIDKIDEDKRQIWFRAGGMNADQDPYFIHYYRINFDGTGLVALTSANGNHIIQFSPERKYYVDTYSRVDMPPAHELRRTSDGTLVCRFEEADISELKENGWTPPEVFVAKGRDGKTDIWGIINRPRHFDPSKKYPVLESIYAGPQGAFVPKSFNGSLRTNALTDLGFILVQIDGMGTAFRSKAFHDVCWHNLSDAGFPDRILWHQEVAKKYPYYDISRVGIFGTSAGGQSAAAAVLFHPEFYKVAVANSGCHDNRLDKASWNEQWMGYMSPDKIWSKDADNWYSQNSNIDNAAKLRGRLLLIVGEMDDNVPPESTFRFVDALTKARKDFELVVVPGANHGAASPVTQRRLQDFFAHNLLGIEPPDRNASGT
jgi:dipeptidyl aminopeptidase/acylaminoacyl peptidase